MDENQTQKEETISISKNALWKGATFVFAALFVVSLFTGGFGMGKDNITGNAVAPTVVNNQQPTTAPVKVEVDDDVIKGDKDAKVTIIEFTDYQCPFCSKFYTETLPSIQKEYIDTGKARLVVRDFPLSSIHPLAQKAAEASECADEQGKYWEYHNKLFENQAALDIASLKKYAADLGLDVAKFNDCLDSGKMASEVTKDTTDGTAAGVRGTPAFFINGKLISGAQPYSVFQQAINAELSVA